MLNVSLYGSPYLLGGMDGGGPGGESRGQGKGVGGKTSVGMQNDLVNK